ncbi:EAL domain-containing protein [Dermatophilaceae bacterium Soc4.6]
MLTVLVTLAIVVGEFMFLSSVYSRGAPVRAQHTLAVQLASGLHEVDGSRAPALVDAAMPGLLAAGVPSGQLEALQQATRAVSVAPTDARSLLTVRTTADALQERLAAQARSIDVQANLIYVALLVVVSLGWMVWFRRLVGRHRELQRQITEQQASSVSEQRLAALVHNASDLVAVLDASTTITYATSSALAVVGLSAEDLTGRQLLSIIAPEDAQILAQHLVSSAPNDEHPVRLRMHHADGRTRQVEGSLVNLVADSAVRGFVLTVRDVTDRVALEEQLTHQALHDPLTGLANRRLFNDRLAHAIERRKADDAEIVVLFCDLDDFKDVNDRSGHDIGDQVLVHVAERVQAALRIGDTVARLGGDEFAILMEGASLADGLDVAHRVVASVSEPILLQGREVAVGVSVGVAASGPGARGSDTAAALEGGAPSPEATPLSSAEILRNADVAMYLAKDRGKAGVAVFESRLHEQAMEQLQVRVDLEQALSSDELVLHFQPTVDLTTGEIAGFEALVRWQHPTRGLLPPISFIPTAERTGQIVPLGQWVLRTACVAAVGMQTPGRRVTISVNVAAAQLASPTFCDEVKQVLHDTGLPPECLQLEIIESVLLGDLDTISARLEALRSLRVRIAIDDFGTGYSSLAYLRRLPVDVVKVDKSFVDNVTTDAHDAALTQAIIAMSQSLQLVTIAEGVEEAGQADWLTAADCSYGQGYLWSRPVPLDQARLLLAKSTRPNPAPTHPAGPALEVV